LKAKKVLTVVGARPQFVKAAVVSRALAKQGLNEVLVHTGQHFDDNMSAVFFKELQIKEPAYNLGIGGGSHAANTGRSMEAIESLIGSEVPDFVLVYGDTDSTLAGALAAAKLCVPIAHVEAGLRSYNRNMPEEINRVLTDHVSSLLFAPTQTAVQNLAREGINGPSVRLVGDVMYDAVGFYTALAAERSNVLERLDLKSGGYVLVTLHRKENTDDAGRLVSILEGLARNDGPVLLPLHPRTQKRIREFGLDVRSPIRIVDPVGYFDMMILQRNARVIATDSGGIQKEAFFHNVPCLTLRDETEWVELVEIGANKLVGADPDAIAEGLRGHKMPAASPIYGTGNAAEVIAGMLA
jgi:UDP-GlcNAc3NAcA epimerase